jgi:hypothetical protein
MKLGVLLGMMILAFLEVARSRFAASYGRDSRDSVVYVAVVSSCLLVLYHAFPDWE